MTILARAHRQSLEWTKRSSSADTLHRRIANSRRISCMTTKPCDPLDLHLVELDTRVIETFRQLLSRAALVSHRFNRSLIAFTYMRKFIFNCCARSRSAKFFLRIMKTGGVFLRSSLKMMAHCPPTRPTASINAWSSSNDHATRDS